MNSSSKREDNKIQDQYKTIYIMCRHKFFTPGAVGSPCNEWISVFLVVYVVLKCFVYSIELKR